MTCPHHPTEILTAETSRYGDLMVCPMRGCSYAVPANGAHTIRMPASALRTVSDAPEPVEVASTVERLLVARIIAKLESEGYEVLRVGQYKAKGSGTDIGYPDLSVRHPTKWPRGIACLLEAKVAGGRIRKRQQELHDAGWSFIVRSAEESLEAVRSVEGDTETGEEEGRAG